MFILKYNIFVNFTRWVAGNVDGVTPESGSANGRCVSVVNSLNSPAQSKHLDFIRRK